MLKFTATDYLEGRQGKMKNYEEKLILEKDLVTLPDAVIPQDGWFNAPENLPNFAYNDIIDWLFR